MAIQHFDGRPRSGIGRSAIALAVAVSVMGGGMALAAKIQCESGTPCRGTASDDVLNGTGGRDDMRGREGDDVLRGRGGRDRLRGGSGADVLRGGRGNDLLVGGPDDDDADELYGGRGNDVLRGGQKDSLFGGKGNDVLYGSSNSEWLVGGPGDDVIHGGKGGDIIRFGPGWGHDLIVEKNNFHNSLRFLPGIKDSLRINLRSRPNRPEVKTVDGSDTINWDNDVFRRIVSWALGDDIIFGDARRNIIQTHGGNDTVHAGAGPDFVNVRDGEGGDIVDCGAGDDIVYHDEDDQISNCEVSNPDQ